MTWLNPPTRQHVLNLFASSIPPGYGLVQEDAGGSDHHIDVFGELFLQFRIT
ncbi:MAG: hypothetical protein M3Q30_13920 [Actinomycetota bacterium]|nr:hypothetical protein [Actinomycetota bacterium]